MKKEVLDTSGISTFAMTRESYYKFNPAGTLDTLGSKINYAAEQTAGTLALQASGAEVPVSEDWRKRASCRSVDPELFFDGDESEAKKICDECPVKIECLTYALENHEPHGVWGGKSERERRRILRNKRKYQ